MSLKAPKIPPGGGPDEAFCPCRVFKNTLNLGSGSCEIVGGPIRALGVLEHARLTNPAARGPGFPRPPEAKKFERFFEGRSGIHRHTRGGVPTLA